MGAPVLVVIPTYDEVDNLLGLTEHIFSNLPNAHILVVDDASPDGTGYLADELSRRDDRVHALHRAAKLGMGTAYVAGFGWALERGYRCVVQIDADHSHDPAALPSLLEGLDEADLVIGSRTVAGGGVDGWGAHRQALSRVGSAYCRLWLGWDLADPTSGYRALSHRAVVALLRNPPRSEGFAFQVEVAYRVAHAGLTIIERPIIFHERQRGRSKLDATIVAEAVAVVPLLRLCRLVDAL